MRRQIPLRDGWMVRQLDTPDVDIPSLLREVEHPGNSWLSTQIPAQVHEVLLAHGLISDPHVGKNAADSAWVAESDWAYACSFPSPQCDDGSVFLRFHGLDSLVTVYLNGHKIGRFDNMFRRWIVDVSGKLAPAGEANLLLLHFAGPLRVISEIEQPPAHVGIVAKHKYLRKSHVDFGSYLGTRPHAVKVGIYDDVLLDLRAGSWIEDVRVRTQISPAHDHGRLTVQVAIGGAGGGQIAWNLTDPDGMDMAHGMAAANGPSFEIEIPNPRLWWPHTHGRPSLYNLSVRLEDEGRLCDRREVAVGLREVELQQVDPASGEPRFWFKVNGHPIFLQGAGMAPFEGMSHCPQPARMHRLLDLAIGARMNLLRVWGDGDLPEDAFYDECDRRGILVWHDFMFGYGMHPDDDPAFLENVQEELTGIVRRLRNHPCILLWVGGNENHMGYDFAHGGYSPVGRRIFEQIMPDICAREDPDRFFHPSSPFGVQPADEERAPNWPLAGDWHDYTTVTFSPQASVPTFASETGRVSAPSLQAMRLFLSPEELWPEGFDPAVRKPGQPAWPPMWQYRAADGAWEKVGALEEFCDPASARDLIRVLGTAHGEYLQRRIERERRGVPDGAPAMTRRCGGNMVWRLNDSWPTIYWSVVDYYLAPKIPYYFLRRAHDAVQISFERTPDRICAWVVNDSPRPIQGTLSVARMRFDGSVRGELTGEVAINPGEARRCLDITPLGPISLRHEFLAARLGDLRATQLLLGERYLALPQAHLGVRLVDGVVEIAADVYARQISLEIEDAVGAIFEDNHFDLVPGESRTVRILDKAGGEALIVRCVNAEPKRLSLT